MDSNERIKAKIKALLLKTTDNGATKEEMESALAKANELMIHYFISENDLKDPFISEKCKLLEVDMIKTAYDINIFLANLSILFDCEHYYNPYYKKLYFFGYEQDTELCGYFYKVITGSCLKEKDRYLKSEVFLTAKNMGYHGRTLVSSFIKGFLSEIAIKMNQMYKERATKLSDEVGLMIQNKKKRVEAEYAKLNKKPKAHSINLRAEEQAFKQGAEVGNKVSLSYGLDTYEQKSTLLLN